MGYCHGALPAMPSCPEQAETEGCEALSRWRCSGTRGGAWLAGLPCRRDCGNPCRQEHPPGCCGDHRGCCAPLAPPGLITGKGCWQRGPQGGPARMWCWLSSVSVSRTASLPTAPRTGGVCGAGMEQPWQLGPSRCPGTGQGRTPGLVHGWGCEHAAGLCWGAGDLSWHSVPPAAPPEPG